MVRQYIYKHKFKDFFELCNKLSNKINIYTKKHNGFSQKV